MLSDTQIVGNYLLLSFNMLDRDKSDIILKWGLTLKKILETRKEVNEEIRIAKGQKDRELVDSFGKLYKESHIPKATLVKIANGKKNATFSTLTAILEALKMTLTDFALIYDKLTPAELSEYKRLVERKGRIESRVQKKSRKPAPKKKTTVKKSGRKRK